MALTPQEVEHIAALARLALAPDEIERMARQLSDILDAAARLNELDTSAIPPTASVLPLSNIWRDDEVQPSLPRDEALANAPETDPAREFFKVKPIME